MSSWVKSRASGDTRGDDEKLFEEGDYCRRRTEPFLATSDIWTKCQVFRYRTFGTISRGQFAGERGVATQLKSQKRCSSASSRPAATRAIWLPTSSVGSGTTAAVAEKLGRKWIATDLGKFGIHTTRKRLIGVQRELKAADKPFRAFEVLNLGRYERQAYLNVGGRLTGQQKEQALAQKEREFRELILRAYKAQPLRWASRSSTARTPVGWWSLVRSICRSGGCSSRRSSPNAASAGPRGSMFWRSSSRWGCFPPCSRRRRGRASTSRRNTSRPRCSTSARWKRARWCSTTSASSKRPRATTRRTSCALRIELTDFSVYYTQGAAEAAIAAMKDGKSEVVCEQGQLYKISKRQGRRRHEGAAHQALD